MSPCRILALCVMLVLGGAATATQDQPAAKESAGDPLPAGATMRLGTTRWRHADTVGFAEFLPGGKQVVTVGDDMTIRVWEFPSGRETRRISVSQNERLVGPTRLARGSAIVAALTPDGKTLANRFKDDTPIRLYDLATGNELRVLETEMPADKLDRLVARLRDTVTAMVFDKDGTKLFVRYIDGSAQIWNATSGKLLQTVKKSVNTTTTARLVAREVNAGGMSLSPDGKTLLLLGTGNAIDLVDVASGTTLSSVAGHTLPLLSVHFTPDGKNLFTRDNEGAIHRWSASTGKHGGQLVLPEMEAKLGFPSTMGTAVALSRDGKIAAQLPLGIAGKAIDITAIQDNKKLASIALGRVSSLRSPSMIFSPDGSLLAVELSVSTREQKLELYETASGKLLHTLPVSPEGNKDGISNLSRGTLVSFSADGKMVASYSRINEVLLWNTSTGQGMARLSIPGGAQIRSLAFTPDGRCLALDLGDGTVSLYELASTQLRQTYGDQDTQPKPKRPALQSQLETWSVGASHVAIAGDGRTLAFAKADQTVRVLDMVTGKEMAVLTGHTGAVNAVAFAFDGKSLASASADTTALVWDMGKLQRPQAPANALTAAALEKCWQALSGADASRAWAAIGELTASPQETVPYLQEHLKAAVKIDAAAIETWIAQLGDEQFKVRDKATRELVKAGEQIVPALDKALAAGPALETQKRLEVVRNQLVGSVLEGDRLRGFRAVEVLERIATPEARQVLKTLADGVPGVLLTITAQQSIKRLEK